MNEIVFIESNKSQWQRLSKVIDGQLQLPVSDVVMLYTQAADDLSYARTHYADSRLIKFLNSLVYNSHRLIYKNRFGNWSKFINFWKEDIPLAVYKHRLEIAISFIIFILAIIIGCFSSAMEPEFCRLILGDYYVNMTLDNIEKGDPMAVYGEMQQSSMFLNIGVNNVRVAFLAFMAGIVTSVGPAMILSMNGIMVGGFFYFFYQKGLATIAWSTIMIHGTLELSAIALAGGAGIVLGNSFLFPRTYTRIRALVNGASDALKIMIGLVPVFVVAAFLESYATREYQSMSLASRMIIILVSLAFLIWYFYYYSKRVYERSTSHPDSQRRGFRGAAVTAD